MYPFGVDTGVGQVSAASVVGAVLTRSEVFGSGYIRALMVLLGVSADVQISTLPTSRRRLRTDAIGNSQDKDSLLTCSEPRRMSRCETHDVFYALITWT